MCIFKVALDASRAALLAELVGHTEKAFNVKLAYMYRYTRNIYIRIFERYICICDDNMVCIFKVAFDALHLTRSTLG